MVPQLLRPATEPARNRALGWSPAAKAIDEDALSSRVQRSYREEPREKPSDVREERHATRGAERAEPAHEVHEEPPAHDHPGRQHDEEPDEETKRRRHEHRDRRLR